MFSYWIETDLICHTTLWSYYNLTVTVSDTMDMWRFLDRFSRAVLPAPVKNLAKLSGVKKFNYNHVGVARHVPGNPSRNRTNKNTSRVTGKLRSRFRRTDKYSKLINYTVHKIHNANAMLQVYRTNGGETYPNVRYKLTTKPKSTSVSSCTKAPSYCFAVT